MDKFIVSARKYRPQNFSTVVGQQHITTTLKNAIVNNQLAHAFLFCGPRGVGKTTCARILAKTINCEHKTKDGEACNVCNSCISFDNGTSLNIHELDAASNNSVDDIRTLVEQVRFAPQAGDYKVYIVDEVHMLSSAAFNAFLKTLEEPPPFAIFILATTEKHKILPTILSRCQIFDFKRISTQDTVDHLQEICEKENIQAEPAALHIIAQKSEGCMRDSLSILDKIVSFTGGQITYSNTLEHLNILDEDYFFSMLDNMQKQQLSDALVLFDTIIQKGFEADTFLEGFAEFIRNLMVSKDPKSVTLLDVAENFKARYLSLAQEVVTGWMVSALNILSEASIGYKQARNKKLFVELVLIKLCYLQQAIEISQSGETKKKITATNKAVQFKSLVPIKVKDPEAVQKKEVVKEAVKPEALLMVEKEPAETNVSVAEEKPFIATKGGNTLKAIKEKIMQQRLQTQQKPIAVTTEALQKVWNEFIQKLSDAKNHSAATNFKLAVLKVEDEAHFKIICTGALQQKFIEKERSELIDFLQKSFNNPSLSYSCSVEETESELQVEKTLTKKQQYQILTKQYPHIQLLKEKLKLELE
ncbi:MAG: DNA polymerase III subunit gamma/tau [Niastella sp.]|nr:DNA polymerase III subunit gamma/tau [Niastella sp.]